MKFDVAITNYKRPTMVKDAVKSCLNQGQLLNRIIVVDDASEDNTAEVIKAINDQRIVFSQRTENGGIAAARRDAFELSDADWLISMDSDHELLPGAIEGMAKLLASAKETVDILGARYLWDTGGVTPLNIPDGIIGYRERITLSAQKDGIGADYLCALSKRIRQTVRWEPLRSGLPDTLFQLDIAKTGKAIFTPDILAFEKTGGDYGWTRGSVEQRWLRRCQDAPDGLKAFELILKRHGYSLRQWGKNKLSSLYRQGAFYALLSDQRIQALRWLLSDIKMGDISINIVGLVLLSMLPKNILKGIYFLRG